MIYLVVRPSLFEKLSICDVMKTMLLRVKFKNAVAG